MIQLQLVNNKTNQIEGWVVGKTPNRELVINMGNRTFTLPINEQTSIKYRVEKVEVKGSAK